MEVALNIISQQMKWPRFLCAIFLSIVLGFPTSWAQEPKWKTPALALNNALILKARSSPVSERLFSSSELTQITQALAREMFSHFGIQGIAAPQMGIGLRIFLLRSSFLNPFNRSYDIFINPSIQPLGNSTNSGLEFCLSAKGFHWVKRYDAIQLEFHQADGMRKVIKLTGARARIAQHELDHLDGKLISEN